MWKRLKNKRSPTSCRRSSSVNLYADMLQFPEDNRNQYNVTNIDKQWTYVKQTIYRLSDRTVKYEIYLQT